MSSSSSSTSITSNSYNLHRQILSETDLKQFLESEPFKKLETFLLNLNESVRGRERVASSGENDKLIEWSLELIKTAEALIEEHPPRDRNSDVNRFGNIAFKDWIFALQDTILPGQMKKLIEEFEFPVELVSELEGYFVNSLGSSQRIDYGTGHELHFLIFLMGLNPDARLYTDLVLKVFSAYLYLMRRLQRTYWLEPAGSHGVWGLDDYHFLPFLFGSAQLQGHPNLRPRAIHSPEIVQYLASQYIYFDCIKNILEIKSNLNEKDQFGHDACEDPLALGPSTTSLRWLSPVLDDISAVKTWDKVNSGLIKMWRVEVMGKLPIMQHLLFGEIILNFKRDPSSNAVIEEESDASTAAANTVHYTHSQRGDCCGNPLPSIYASLASATSENSSPLYNFLRMLAGSEITVETNELVQIATLSSSEILCINDPFECEFESPLFTYPFFGESETLCLSSIPASTPESTLDSLKVLIVVNVSLCKSVDFYLGVSDEGILRPAADEIENKLKEMCEAAGEIKLKCHRNWKEFQDVYAAEFETSSAHINETVVDPQFYNRLQILLPFFIEAATPIDLKDSKWSVKLALNAEGTMCQGFLTAYNYYRFPEGKKTRISQVLVFPRFQHQNIGTRLYSEYCDKLRKEDVDVECGEILVEDPTDGFERLRATCDWKEAHSRGIWQTETDEKIILQKLMNEMKFTKSHAERLLNLHLNLKLSMGLKNKNKNKKRVKTAAAGFDFDSGLAAENEDVLRRRVKKWLLIKFKKDLPEERVPRLEKLNELYEAELEEFIEPIIERLIN